MELELTFERTGGAVVPAALFGCNIEHTRSCLFGGLSAQMLRNRKFTGIPSANCGCAEGWPPSAGYARPSSVLSQKDQRAHDGLR